MDGRWMDERVADVRMHCGTQAASPSPAELSPAPPLPCLPPPGMCPQEPSIQERFLFW